MTNQQRVAELESKALPIPTRVEALSFAVKFFKTNLERSFRLFSGLEFMTHDQLRSLAISGSTLEPIEMALKSAGVPTTGTVGGLLDAQVVTESDVHVLACDCNVGVRRVDGRLASNIFRAALQRG